MSKWRWEHQGDGRILRLFRGGQKVLVIDETRLHIEDKTGAKRYKETIGQGCTPSFEDEKLILNLLNDGTEEEINIGKIFGEILKEREHQDREWGSDGDNEHTVNDWVTFINRHTTYFAEDCNESIPARKTCLIKVAALAVAAIEALDRNQGFPPRHYDET